MKTTAEVGGVVMLRIITLATMATTRLLNGAAETIDALCEHLRLGG